MGSVPLFLLRVVSTPVGTAESSEENFISPSFFFATPADWEVSWEEDGRTILRFCHDLPKGVLKSKLVVI